MHKTGVDSIIKSGALVTILLLLPNLVWLVLPKTVTNEAESEPLLLTIAENIGRIAVFVLPFFYALDFQKRYSVPVTVGMGIALLVYYGCWARYFLNEQASAYFSAPFLGIPLPMAIMPTLFFILSSYLMSSWWMLTASIGFGIIHIWVSAISL